MALSKCNTNKLRHRIKFESKSTTRDAVGGNVITYATSYETWASIEPASANQMWQAQQLSLRVTHKIIIRYTTGIDISQRINFGGRLFEINKIINPEERNIWLHIEANEGDAS